MVAKIVLSKKLKEKREKAKRQLDSIAHAKKLKKFDTYWSKLKPNTITNLKRAGIDKNEAKDRYVLGNGLGLRVNMWQMDDKPVVPKGSFEAGEKAKKNIIKKNKETKEAILKTIDNVKKIFKD